jgi:23S rRNA pseudouridine1911/1915/1917 synthase
VNGERFVVAAPGELLAVIAAQLPGWGRNTLRERLRGGCVTVNGEVAVRGDRPVAPGDVVEVRARGAGAPARAARDALPVLFEDGELCAIDKPAGLLAVGTDDGGGAAGGRGERTALALLRAQLGAGTGELWPLHRLDRETSGVMLFARTRGARAAVQARWRDVEKIYAAVVEGSPSPADGTIDAPLWEDGGLRVHAGAHRDARPAVTHYRTVARGVRRTLLEVRLDTGRKHQIRVHLAARGCPVVGDDRYGSRDQRLCLHAQRLELAHPRDGHALVLEAPVPAAFARALATG